MIDSSPLQYGIGAASHLDDGLAVCSCPLLPISSSVNSNSRILGGLRHYLKFGSCLGMTLNIVRLTSPACLRQVFSVSSLRPGSRLLFPSTPSSRWIPGNSVPIRALPCALLRTSPRIIEDRRSPSLSQLPPCPFLSFPSLPFPPPVFRLLSIFSMIT